MIFLTASTNDYGIKNTKSSTKQVYCLSDIKNETSTNNNNS